MEGNKISFSVKHNEFVIKLIVVARALETTSGSVLCPGTQTTSKMHNVLHRVFVYGTLKRCEPNEHWISDSSRGTAKYIGKGTTLDPYPLVIASKYNIPFLIDCPGKGFNVGGEVYEVDEQMLKNLDVLEEHPIFYVREIRGVKLDNGSQIQAWVYLLKKYKTSLLELPLLKTYSSKGDHGLIYCEREERNSPYSARLDVQGE